MPTLSLRSRGACVCTSRHLAQPAFEEIFLNLEFYPLGINRKRFKTPAAPLQTQFDEADIVPCDDRCVCAR